MKFNQQELATICILCREKIIRLQEKYEYNSKRLLADSKYNTYQDILQKAGEALRDIHYPRYHVEELTERND